MEESADGTATETETADKPVQPPTNGHHHNHKDEAEQKHEPKREYRLCTLDIGPAPKKEEIEKGGFRRSASARRPTVRATLDRDKSRGSSASLILLGSRRSSLVISPTTEGLSKKSAKHHVQFQTANGSALKPPSPGSSSSSSDDSLETVVRAPDGGWGWVVVAAAFVVNMIADGITFSFGVLFVEFLEYFGESKSKTAWIGSLFMAMPLLSGPVASFLTDRYGCRKCCIVGGLLSAFGFIISSFTNSIELLFFTFGVLAGIGLSLCYVTAVVIVAYYFESKRSFATGLSVCGSGIGTFIFAPIIQFLLDEYGWRGTTLILAGFFLNLCLCGMLMRDLDWTKEKRKQFKIRHKNRGKEPPSETANIQNVNNTSIIITNNEEQKKIGTELSDVEILVSPKDGDIDSSRLFSSLVSLPTFVRNGEKVPIEVLETMTANHHLYQVLLQNYPSLLISRSFSDSARITDKSTPSGGLSARFLSASPECTGLEDCAGKGLNKQFHHHGPRHQHKHHQHEKKVATADYLKDLKVHRHSLTYRNAMLNINKYKLRASSCPDIYKNSMDSPPKEKSDMYSGLKDLGYLLAEMLDFSYFSNIKFSLFALSNFLLYIWYDVPYVYLADYATEIGYTEHQGSMLISVIGILNMAGEVALGWLGDLDWIQPNYVYAVSMAFCGAVVALVPLLTDYVHITLVSGAFGITIAANYALTSIILVEQITIERFTNAYGLLLLVQGVANLVGPPLAGWLYDITGEYELPFYLGGFFIALSGVLLVIPTIIETCSQPCRQSSEKKKPLDEEPQPISNIV